MLSQLKAIPGIKLLSKEEQKTVKGTGRCCDPNNECCATGGGAPSQCAQCGYATCTGCCSGAIGPTGILCHSDGAICGCI